MLSVRFSSRKLRTLVEELGDVIERLEDRRDDFVRTINTPQEAIDQVQNDILFFTNEQRRLRRILESPEPPYEVAREGGPLVGGAMIKTLPELLADLRESPTEATLRNVLSDMKESGNQEIVRYAEYNERYLNLLTPLQKQSQVLMIVREVMNFLPRHIMRGGAMIKNFRELLADIRADPSESTLLNVLSDMKESDQDPVRSYGQSLEQYFQGLRPDEKPAAVAAIIQNLVPFLQIYAGRERRRHGGQRKTRKSNGRKNMRKL